MIALINFWNMQVPSEVGMMPCPAIKMPLRTGTGKCVASVNVELEIQSNNIGVLDLYGKQN